MASDQQDDEYQKFLKARQSEEQPRSVLDQPRPFSKPPKGAQAAVIIVLLAAAAVFMALRVSLWLSTGPVKSLPAVQLADAACWLTCPCSDSGRSVLSDPAHHGKNMYDNPYDPPESK